MYFKYHYSLITYCIIIPEALFYVKKQKSAYLSILCHGKPVFCLLYGDLCRRNAYDFMFQWMSECLCACVSVSLCAYVSVSLCICTSVFVNLMCVWPCIIYENDRRYQLDATIVIYYHKYLYMFRAFICPSSGVQVVCYCIWHSTL
jgi:hypothetical protein